MKYKNPWYQAGGLSKEIFDRTGCHVTKSACGRGCIVKAFDGCYEYVINGILVTQRAGKNIKTLDQMIGACLDNIETNDWMIIRAKECFLSQKGDCNE